MNKRTANKLDMIAITLLIFLVFVATTIVLDRLYTPTVTVSDQATFDAYATQHHKNNPPAPFHHDGCTLFPNTLMFSFLQTPCFNHDVAYYFGGTSEERKAADQRLRTDVANHSWFGKLLAYPIYIGVRLCGDSLLTKQFNAHWGYGWD